MYLMATHIPIYLDGDRTFVDDSWFADLELARRFFAPRFGPVHVIGPSLPIELAQAKHLSEVGRLTTPGLTLHPSIDERTRIRQFWPKAARRWHRDLASLMDEAQVIHASVDDPFRPMQLATLRAGIRAGKTTVVIGFDMDVWEVFEQKLEGMSPVQAQLHVARTAALDLWMRACVRRASVAMLKEGLVFDRYSKGARNPKAFCHSMHSERHLIDDDAFEPRIGSMLRGRPLRFGYCGRFIERKGLGDAIGVLARARQHGVDASFELIGEGPEREALERLAVELGVGDHVSFAGPFPYGEELHDRLRSLDALLFTPTEEDTPRMVYDAYAAGLPILGTTIPFLRRRAERDGAAILWGIGANAEGAARLMELDADRTRLAKLSTVARAAGAAHTVERWYGRRSEWTADAIDRDGGPARAPAAPPRGPTSVMVNA